MKIKALLQMRRTKIRWQANQTSVQRRSKGSIQTDRGNFGSGGIMKIAVLGVDLSKADYGADCPELSTSIGSPTPKSRLSSMPTI
jgi:hypothetical protein